MKTKLLLLAVLTSLPAMAQTQWPGATVIQQAPSMMNAATLCTNATGTAQQTLTITPPSGLYVYLTNVDIVNSATTAPTASLITTTSTNLGGIKWYDLAPASATAQKMNWIAGQPLKSSSAGTAVTIVSNAAVTNVTFSLNACYFFAP